MLNQTSLPLSVITDGRITDAAFRLACYISWCSTDGEWAEDVEKVSSNLGLSKRNYFRLKGYLIDVGILIITETKYRYSVTFSLKTETFQPETIKEVKNAKNGTNESFFLDPVPHAPQASKMPLKSVSDFEGFYDTYPRKVGRRSAEKAYAAALKRGATPEQLKTAAEAYLAFTSERNTEAKFIPHPATWLNADRWEDDDIKPFVGQLLPSEGELAVQTI